MRVYNLSKQPVDFHGHTIPPNGGSAEYPGLEKFLPARDRKLEEQKILSFGILPTWWVQAQTGPAAERVVESATIETGVKAEPPPLPEPAKPPELTSGWVERPLTKKKMRG